MKQKDIFVVVILIGLIVIVRLLPHLPNFAPVAAAALLAGAYLPKRWALIIPVAGMFLSDLVIGFYNWEVMLAVYGSFLVIGVTGWYLKNNHQIVNVITASLLASLFFYLLTNFAVWRASGWYAHNLAGLLLSYEMALPFFRYTLLGDLVYTAALFGLYELVVFAGRPAQVKSPSWQRVDSHF